MLRQMLWIEEVVVERGGEGFERLGVGGEGSGRPALRSSVGMLLRRMMMLWYMVNTIARAELRK